MLMCASFFILSCSYLLYVWIVHVTSHVFHKAASYFAILCTTINSNTRVYLLVHGTMLIIIWFVSNKYIQRELFSHLHLKLD